MSILGPMEPPEYYHWEGPCDEDPDCVDTYDDDEMDEPDPREVDWVADTYNNPKRFDPGE
jgi:hypothetical protein